MINTVTSEDSGLYTCSLTFTLNGVTGSVSETIDAWVTGTNVEEGGDFRAPLHQANVTFRVQFSSDRLCMSWRKHRHFQTQPGRTSYSNTPHLWHCHFRWVFTGTASARTSQWDHQGRPGWVAVDNTRWEIWWFAVNVQRLSQTSVKKKTHLDCLETTSTSFIFWLCLLWL